MDCRFERPFYCQRVDLEVRKYDARYTLVVGKKRAVFGGRVTGRIRSFSAQESRFAKAFWEILEDAGGRCGRHRFGVGCQDWS